MYISFEYYRIFYYVAKYGSISQAAEALMNNCLLYTSPSPRD